MWPFPFFFLTFLMMCFSLISAQSIQDIANNDANYNIIKTAVNQGYLSLYKDNTFKPNTPLSRRDAVIIIHELEQKLKSTSPSLSTQDYQELTSLSRSFKQLFNQTNNSMISLKNDNQMLRHEHKLLLHEVTALQTDNNRYKKERKLLFGLIAFSSILGFLYP